MTAARNNIGPTAMTAACAAILCLASACWQAAGIDVIDLPGRDGDLDAEDFETESDGVEVTDDGVPPDPVEIADPDIDDVTVDDVAVEDIITPMNLEALCQAYATVRCDYMESCCTEEDYANFDWILRDFDCNDSAGSADFNACMDTYGPSVEEGKIVLDPGAFSRCQSALLNLTSGECLGWTRFGRYMASAIELDCSDLFAGTVPLGEACRFRAECAGGTCCVDSTCTTCTSPDGDCRNNEACPVGQRCIDDLCTSPSGTNEACDQSDEYGLSDCAPDLFCAGTACEALRDADRDCGSAMEGNFSCSGICSDEGVCDDLCGR
jgi:hypothetical protein